MKRLHLNLDLTAVIVLLAAGVFLPVLLATAVGIVALVFAEDVSGIITGVLVISFAVTAMGGALITVVLTGRKARLARRQADFVANVSHEFRTPLSVIKLYTQTLQSGKLMDDPKQTVQCLATILRETEWLDALIDRVLTWRASSKDMMVLDLETRLVSEAVTEAIERFRSMVAPEGLLFSSLTESKLLVSYDIGALRAVVLNLLTNAYKYTGEEKRISVRVRDEEGHVAIDVQDNGVGMTSAEVKRIFQAFYRVEGKDGNTASGVGLGLAIARHLVYLHKGSITVNSEVGEGSTFTVRLPAMAKDL